MAKTNPALTKSAPQKPAQPATPPKPGAAPGMSDATSPDAIAAKTNVPQQYRASYLATIKAAISIVMSDKAHTVLLQAFQKDPSPVPNKIANGVLALLQIVAHEAKGAMAPQVLVPAGTYLVSWCGHFIARAGIAPVTDKDIAVALRVFMARVVQKFGQGQQPQQQQPGLLSGQQQPPQAAAPPPNMPAAPAASPAANPGVGPAGGPAAGQLNPLGRA